LGRRVHARALTFWIPQIAGTRLLVIATYRTDQLQQNAPLTIPGATDPGSADTPRRARSVIAERCPRLDDQCFRRIATVAPNEARYRASLRRQRIFRRRVAQKRVDASNAVKRRAGGSRADVRRGKRTAVGARKYGRGVGNAWVDEYRNRRALVGQHQDGREASFLDLFQARHLLTQGKSLPLSLAKIASTRDCPTYEVGLTPMRSAALAW